MAIRLDAEMMTNLNKKKLNAEKNSNHQRNPNDEANDEALKQKQL